MELAQKPGRKTTTELRTANSRQQWPRVLQRCTEVTRRPRGAGSCPGRARRQDGCPAVPTGSCLWKRARQRAGGQGQAALRASPATHSAGHRPPPGSTITPFTSAKVRWCHLWTVTGSQSREPEQGCRAAAKLHTQQRATLARRQSAALPARAKNLVCSPQPWHWVPWASCLLPRCLSFPSWQGWQGMGRGWAAMGGPLPRVVAACDTQREPTVTQSCGDLLGSDPMAWGQEGGSRGTLYADRHSQMAAVATWHGGNNPSSGPHTWWAENNPKKSQPGHRDDTRGCMGTASLTCKDEECWWCPPCLPLCCQDTCVGHPRQELALSPVATTHL